jgi:cytochrome c oxidase subunit III
MANVLVAEPPVRPPAPPSGGGGDWGDHSFRGRPANVALPTYQLGVWLAMGGICMVFIAFTSALIVRRGVSLDWRPTEFPRILWLNSAVLVMSSLTVESARKALRKGLASTFRTWWWISTALGVAFLAGQVMAWRQLAAAGVYLSSNPSSSFLYLLSGAHGVHLVGGVIAFLAVALRRKVSRVGVEAISLYWHFMDGLWLYLLMVLLYWR